MKKITLLIAVLLAGQLYTNAQTSCNDWNGYPQSKEVGASCNYTLIKGIEENAAQTYHYSGPGKITHIRIYGSTPNAWVNLVTKIYDVDANGRPTTVIGSQNFLWMMHDNFTGYKEIIMPGGGIAVSSNFAISVEIAGGFHLITKFNVRYTGATEGAAEDLASLAGTSTGYNWASAKNSFSKDCDFYIIPKMKHYITPGFTASTQCVEAGVPVTFTNTTKMTTDRMFNKIGLTTYTGPEYFYTWNFGDGSPVSHAVNPTHTYSVGSVHTVTLTATIDGWNNKCSATYTKQLSVGLAASVSSVTNVTCNGGSNGSIVALASSGGSPYTYSLDGITYQPGATFSGLSAGNYNVHVKDAMGCVKTATATVTEPAPIVFAAPTSTNSSCGTSDGGLLVSATNAVQYSINGTTWQASGSFTNLHAGGYTVWAKDATGCTKSTNVTVTDLGSPALSLLSFTHTSCNSASNGSLVVLGSGGSGTLQYSLNGTTFQPTGTFNNLTAGTYNVQVKDALGCIGIRTVVLSEPPVLALTAAVSSAVLCNGGYDGQISVTSSTGGTGTHSYSIDNVNYQTSGIFNGLAAGTHTVSVKDIAGCISKTTVAVSQPTPVLASKSITHLSCNGSSDGAITVSGSGGTPGYEYSLDSIHFYPTGDFYDLSAGTYNIIVKDANGCLGLSVATITQPAAISATVTTGNSTCGNANGNILIAASGGSGSGYQYSINGTNWNSTGSFTGLVDSSYVIQIKDGSNCSILALVFVTDANGPVVQTVNHTNISCFGGSDGTITVSSVSGGTGTLQYSVNGSPWQSSGTFTNLPAGEHTVIVKDALGCSGSYTVELTQPNAIVVNTAVTHVDCYGNNNGSVTITAGGGSGTLAYSIGNNYQSSNVFTNLTAGVYIAYVRDAGGCISTKVFTITQPKPLDLAIQGILNVTCHGAHNGSIIVHAVGGTGTLNYSINGSTYQSSNIFTGLSGGLYTVYVKDNNGCIKTTMITIHEPMAIAVSANIFDVTCSGGNDGVVDITPTGGTAPYNFGWSNAVYYEDIFNVPAGTYSLTIADANGCTFESSYTVNQPANPLVVNAVILDASSSTAFDGEIDITMTGGTPPYQYNWSNGATTQDVFGLLPGPYLVTITDINGCVTTGIYTVNAVTGIQPEANNYNINIYPNPANDFVIVSSIGRNIHSIDIYNVMGEVVYREEPGKDKLHIDLSSQPAGLYFVKMNINGNLVTRKIQVNR